MTRPAPVSAPRTARRRTRRPLLLVEAATLLSGTGNGVALMALPWLVLERTGSPVAAGVLAAATAIPLLVSSLFSGTVVDIVGRRRTAVVSDALSGLSVAAIPVLDATVGLTVPVLVALAVLGAVFDPAGVTARETLVPAASHAAGWRLERANSVHEAVWGLAFLVGPGVGGVLIAMVGAVGTLWVTAGGFTASLLMVALVRLPGADSPLPHDRPAGIWRGTLEGLAFGWRDRLLRSIALVTVAVVAVYLPIEAVVLPTYFVDAGSPARLGAVVMTMSAGGVVGALAYGAWGHHVSRHTAFVVALVGACLAVLGMAVLPPFPALLGLAAATGLLYGPINPLANYAMQTRTPERLRGRVVGVMTSAEYAAGPAGYLLAGPLVEGLGPRRPSWSSPSCCWWSASLRCRCAPCDCSTTSRCTHRHRTPSRSRPLAAPCRSASRPSRRLSPCSKGSAREAGVGAVMGVERGPHLSVGGLCVVPAGPLGTLCPERVDG